ncbi:prolyl oligopeptidase family serine peptidase [Erythrobacter arachoides]|uniref:Prolyl oligopeptidase family serine peptidase n=1 Tax=Aurantiacibacter arachoides TaxID=1850444 RepID=A0A844ZWM7_9SPHN|nr:S9 family peptidase [Aurantiacibacter arachoides]MXO92701.1 prolyl oligopeptidase family serine peptidase [Aurantiacibacter arachoides]GGD55127.1 peptidase [Aurantiacibacter arachoides]
MQNGWVFGAVAALAMTGGLTDRARAQDQDSAQAVAAAHDWADTPVPPAIDTSAFASQSQLSRAQLSPDGSLVAFTVLRDEHVYISIYNAGTLELVDGASLGEPDDLNWFRWVGNDRILVSMTVQDIREEYHFSRLLSFELGSRRLQPLVLPNMSFDGDDVVHYDEDGGYVLASISRAYGAYPDVWRFDLPPAGQDLPEPVRVQSSMDRVFHWIADETGVLRMAIRYHGRGRYEALYRSAPDQPWREIARTRIDDEDAFEFWDFHGLRAGSDIGYTFGVPEGGDRQALMEYDFASGRPVRVVYSSPDEDVTSVQFGTDGQPISVGYSGDSFRREWIDPELRRWQQQLSQALSGSDVTILDMSANRETLLVSQAGPADPGALYVFAPEDRHLQLFAEMRPQVDAQVLATPRPVRYAARDGTSIHGYLTLPRGREPRGLPLIVHPHGGPYGIRDTDDYDDMVQLLANRGYAVIQPNYRGSGGYGEAFELLGNGQIGRAMQDDLDDAVAHLVAQGIVDPQRVCILGGSYGGFAALWGAIRNPEIYRCAVSFAGVTHFERQLHDNRNYLFGRNRGRWWDRVDGDQTNFDLDDVSPAVQVARLTRPVLLVHGEDDRTVPYTQYELMVGRANRAGVEIETLSLEDTGHGFADPVHEQAYYDAVVAFLARHNPAD